MRSSWLARILAASLRAAPVLTPELRVTLAELLADPHASSIVRDLLEDELAPPVRAELHAALTTSPHRALRALSLLPAATDALSLPARRRLVASHPREVLELVRQGAAPQLATVLLDHLLPPRLRAEEPAAPTSADCDLLPPDVLAELALVLYDLPSPTERTSHLRALLRVLDAHLAAGEEIPPLLGPTLDELLTGVPGLLATLTGLAFELRAPLLLAEHLTSPAQLELLRAGLLLPVLQAAALPEPTPPEVSTAAPWSFHWRDLARLLDISPSQTRPLRASWGRPLTSERLRHLLLRTGLQALTLPPPAHLEIPALQAACTFLLGEVSSEEWARAAAAAGCPLPLELRLAPDMLTPAQTLEELASHLLRLPAGSSEHSLTLAALHARIPLADLDERSEAADAIASLLASPLPTDLLDELILLADPHTLDAELENLDASPEADQHFVEVASRLPYVCDPDEIADRADPEAVAARLAARLLDPTWSSPAAEAFAEGDVRDLGEWRGRAILAAARFTELTDHDLLAIPWPAYAEAASLEDARRLEARLAGLLTQRFGTDPLRWRSFDTCAEEFTGSLGELVELVCALCAPAAADDARTCPSPPSPTS